MTTLEIEFAKAGLTYDRMVTDNFALPYSYEDVKVQPNELAVAKTFNLKISRLYDNLIYLYGLCKVADFNIPSIYHGWIGYAFGDIENLAFYPSDFSTQFANSVLSSALYKSTQAVSFYSTIAPTTNNLIFSTKDNIYLYSIGDGDFSINLVIEQTTVDPLSGTLCFSSIGGITTKEDDILYVSDTIFNNIYSYKLKDVIGDDNIKSQKLFLLTSIGGTGTSKDKIKFSKIGKILFAKNSLIVEDTDNKCFKVYDKDLNWINTSVNTTLFDTASTITCMSFSELESKLYVCDNKSLYILDVNSDYSILSSTSYNLSDIVTNDDSIVDIKFANYDKNVFYILTKKLLIKKWITKPVKNIGIFTTDGGVFGGDYFKWLTVTKTPNNKTDILLANLLSPVPQTIGDDTYNYIGVFEDGLNIISLFKTDVELNYYSKNAILINPNEYNSSWIYNKSIKKMLYNLSLFVNNVGYRFFSGENRFNTPVYLYRGYNDFFRYNNVLNTNNFSNIFINENFQSETINRCFSQIHAYQQLVLQRIISNEPVEVDLSPRKVSGFEYKFYTGGYE